jgi:hypothetical protein
VEKRCAIKSEDYDAAKKKKEQMEEYRTVYHHLEVHNLLDMGMVCGSLWLLGSFQ